MFWQRLTSKTFKHENRKKKKRWIGGGLSRNATDIMWVGKWGKLRSIWQRTWNFGNRLWKVLFFPKFLHTRAKISAALKPHLMGRFLLVFFLFYIVRLCWLSHLCLNSSQLPHQPEHRCGCESCCGDLQCGDRSNSTVFCPWREQQGEPGSPECAGVCPLGWISSHSFGSVGFGLICFGFPTSPATLL